MSELKRRSPEEVELWYLGKIASMTVEIMDLKAHAVEVLAVLLIEKQRYLADDLGISPDHMSADEYRAEARALLGWGE